jgi:hypothetical protein
MRLRRIAGAALMALFDSSVATLPVQYLQAITDDIESSLRQPMKEYLYSSAAPLSLLRLELRRSRSVLVVGHAAAEMIAALGIKKEGRKLSPAFYDYGDDVIHPLALAERMARMGHETDHLIICNRHWAERLFLSSGDMGMMVPGIRDALMFPLQMPATPYSFIWGTGFDGPESQDQNIWRWSNSSDGKAVFTVVNHSLDRRKLRLEAEIISANKDTADLVIAGLENQVRVDVPGRGVVAADITLLPGRNDIRFLWQGNVVQPAPHGRHLSFAVMNMRLTAEGMDTKCGEAFYALQHKPQILSDLVFHEDYIRRRLHEAGCAEVVMVPVNSRGIPIAQYVTHQADGAIPYVDPDTATVPASMPLIHGQYVWVIARMRPEKIIMPTKGMV